MSLDGVEKEGTHLYGLDPQPASNIMPRNAAPAYAEQLTKVQNLINALYVHPAIQNNKPLMESDKGKAPPKETQNKVYFMWDFCCRSRHILLSRVDPTLAAEARPGEDSKNGKQEGWEDVVGRNMFANVLIHDTTGKLAAMTGEKGGEEIDFGDDVKNAAKAFGGRPGGCVVM